MIQKNCTGATLRIVQRISKTSARNASSDAAVFAYLCRQTMPELHRWNFAFGISS